MSGPRQARATFAASTPSEPRGGALSCWRITFKMALRQSLRSWPSSVLVILLVLIPLTGVSAAAVYAESLAPTTAQRVDAELGGSEAWLRSWSRSGGTRQYLDEPNTDFVYDPTKLEEWIDPAQDPSALVDAGRLVQIGYGTASVETEAGFGNFEVSIGDAWDPLLEGRYTLLDGRAPASPDEMLVTPEALIRLGVSIGGDVTVKNPDAVMTVTGTMSSRLEPATDAMIFVPAGGEFEAVPSESTWYAEDWHPTMSDVHDLNAQGVAVFDRTLAQGSEGLMPALDRSSGTSWAFYSASAAALVFCTYLVLLLAGSAFSVSAKRQQRALAVAASVGASRADVFRIVLFQGLIMGLAGGVLGAAAGIGLAKLALSVFDDGTLAYTWGMAVPWWLLVGIVAFAAVVGTLSALLPARAATRGDTLASLRGARRPVTVSAKRPKVGLALIVIGALLVVVAVVVLIIAYNIREAIPGIVSAIYAGGMASLIVGPLLLQIGVVIAGHWLLSQTSRILSRVGVGGRLAARDAVANPGRSVPSFGAIAACAFLATASIGGVATLMNMDADNASYAAPLGVVAGEVSEYTETGTAQMAPADVPALTSLAAKAEELVLELGAAETATTFRPVWPVGTPDSEGWDTFDDTQTMAVPEVVREDTCVEGEECPRSFYTRAGAGSDRFLIVEPDDIGFALGAEVSASQRDAYAQGSVIVTDQQWLAEDKTVAVSEWRVQDLRGDGATEDIFDPEVPVSAQPAANKTVNLDAFLIDTETTFNEGSQVYIAPTTAEELGLEVMPLQVLARFTDLTTRQLDVLFAQAESLGLSMSTPERSMSLSISEIEAPPAAATWLWLILGAVTVIVIAASAVSLGLSRVERRPDDATLTAVGATPGVRRSINAWQALVISGFGCIVGTVAGLLPVLGVVYILEGAGQEGLTFTEVPWLWYGLLALVLPVAVALVSALVPPRTPDVTRRTAIA